MHFESAETGAVATWLASINLSRYADIFARHHIEPELLRDLTDEDLQKIGVASLGHRRAMLRATAALRPSADPARPSRPERRHLTVMFCDLVGSTTLSARLDPEDMREVIRAYQDACAGPVARYDGTIAKFLGDGVLAYFGFPCAHEDDAERAVRAGLDVVAAVARLATPAGVPLKARVGVATGLVVVGDLIGSGSAQEQAVVGETPNLAARLQALARPGKVVVAPATRHLLGRSLTLRSLGGQRLRGFEAPVEAWVVAGAVRVDSRFEASRDALLTRFVGREAEMERLLQCQRLAFAGRGQAVLVTGEPGIGKSRMADALASRIARERHRRLRCQCSPYHLGSALHPLVGQLERAAEFAPDDPPARRLDKVEALLAQDAPDVAALAPAFADLLAIPTGDRYPPSSLTPAERRRRILAALLDHLECIARWEPILYIYEDAQWADPTSLELLSLAIERIADLPVLAIVTLRPGLEQRWLGCSNVTLLRLGRLATEPARSMIESLAGARDMPPDVIEQIIERTDGVPLFIEELTKTVIETAQPAAPGEAAAAGPTRRYAIPGTLRDPLMARLDSLGSAKPIAQAAAVIGREFSVALLEKLLPDGQTAAIQPGLDRIEAAGLILRARAPQAGAYAFKHALVRDAAYESLLRSARRDMHARAAAGLERDFPESVAAAPELPAQHYAAAQLADKAVSCWLRAGWAALRQSALAEAAGHLTRGLELVAEVGDADARAELELGLEATLARTLTRAEGYVAPEVAQAYRRVRALCDRSGHQPNLLLALFGLFIFHFLCGHLRVAHQTAKELLAVAERTEQPAWVLTASWSLGCASWHLGDNRAAADRFFAARALHRGGAETGLAAPYDIGVLTHSFLESVLINSGSSDAGAQAGREAIRLARQHHDPTNLCIASVQRAVSMLLRHDPDSASPFAEESLMIAGQMEFVYLLAVATAYRGWALAGSGMALDGVDQIRRGTALWRESSAGIGLAVPALLAMLAEAQTAAGEPAAALAATDEALACIDTNDERQWESLVHCCRGEAFAALAAADRAENAYQAALAIARRQEGRAWELRAAVGLATLRRAQGRRAEARDLLASASRLFSESDAMPDARRARAMLDEP
jgi:class 3 adenylate cyclase